MFKVASEFGGELLAISFFGGVIGTLLLVLLLGVGLLLAHGAVECVVGVRGAYNALWRQKTIPLP